MFSSSKAVLDVPVDLTMAHMGESEATLRIVGDDLDPAEVTRLLGCEPSRAHAKGQEIVGRATGTVRIARFGAWSMTSQKRVPEDLDGQVEEILSKLTSDLSVWKQLAARYEIDLFCGLFMTGSNEGLSISAASARALGERGIDISLDVYAPDPEAEGEGA